MKMLSLLLCVISFVAGMFHKEVTNAAKGGWHGAVDGWKAAKR